MKAALSNVQGQQELQFLVKKTRSKPEFHNARHKTSQSGYLQSRKHGVNQKLVVQWAMQKVPLGKIPGQSVLQSSVEKTWSKLEGIFKREKKGITRSVSTVILSQENIE